MKTVTLETLLQYAHDELQLHFAFCDLYGEESQQAAIQLERVWAHVGMINALFDAAYFVDFAAGEITDEE